MMVLRALGAVLFAGVLAGQGAVAQSVHVEGAVLKPGAYQWQQGARLHDATVAGQVRSDAWFLGAALLRDSALEPQQRLKAGVLFDLRVNQLHARATNDAELLQLVEQLQAQVADMPVTGRVRAELNPFQLLLLQHNQLLQAGDRLVYPTRPTQVRVMGAVAADCVLAFDPAQALKSYLRQCPAHPAADRNVVQVIQPDGQVSEVGIAHWNEQQVDLAVGAVIYRPLRAASISAETAELNRDMAALLATQYQLGGRFSE